jgi:predicted GIY-YIG superfamily endonuclease
MTRTVYLLHFDRKLHHAGHYLGSADDLDRRLAQHRAGRGARLIEVITEAGIGFRLARTWEGDRTLERRLKRRKEAPRLCPFCTGRPRALR